MQYTIKSLSDTVFKSALDVYEVFKNYFGEDKVDLQNIPSSEDFICLLLNYDIIASEDSEFSLNTSILNSIKSSYASLRPFIIVWWPKVTVSNENDKSIDIYNLYAKIEITMEGTIPYENRGFQLTKATFTPIQFFSGYVHSHVPTMNNEHIPTFQNPCLGRGPINATINSLKNENNEITWMLFCSELASYVTVESLSGGPYIKMESLYRGVKHSSIFTTYNINPYPNHIYFYEMKDTFKEFIKYYLKHNHLSFVYANGEYSIGIECYDYLLDISNAFIEWINKNGNKALVDKLFENEVLLYAKISNRTFYRPDTIPEHTIARLANRPILKFKEQDIKMNIMETNTNEVSNSILLNYTFSMHILGRILQIINYRYKNEYRNTTPGSTEERTSAANKTVCYL